ncbi:hypothetical protein E8E14_010298 [Neopestalotiopsis sp. 37M]|nr:hypothetical protein E8E14_010298 [Neopestalotiopsis sp. 37M]
MAWNTTPKREKTAIFPGKFKTFVRDVAGLKRTASGNPLSSPRPSTAESTAPTESERAWSIASDFDCPEEQPEHKAGISVQLSLDFDDPLEFSCKRCYNSSSEFKPSERLLRGLLRRIDHGAFELITRKDPVATATTKGDGKDKPRRFQMTFEISQKGSIWATRTYSSYQKDVMTANSVKEVVLSSHRLIGLFLRRHDPDFIWRDGPFRDEIPEGPETAPYKVGGVQPMQCIPRSRFLERTQTFEALPGFKLELSITSRCQRRRPPEWHQNLEVDSEQTSPLNLAVAEALFANASHAVEGALLHRRRAVEERHRQSCGFIAAHCPHYEEDATRLNLRITNNLGPQFEHLQKVMASKLVLVTDFESKNVAELVKNLEKALQSSRDLADRAISATNDFEFRIVELSGRGWTLDEPLVFTLGPSDSYSRRSIQAILDRVQAGVADVLRGNAATVRMTAAKRGHYILDKTLLAPRDASTDAGRWSIPSKNKTKVVDKLRRRVLQDIDMICKDTCSLDNLDESEPAAIKDLPSKVDVFGQAEFEAIKIPLPGTPCPDSMARPRSPADGYATPPGSAGSLVPQSPGTALTNISPERPKPRSFAYYRDGVRAFPLISPTSSYGFIDKRAPPSSMRDDRPVDALGLNQSIDGQHDTHQRSVQDLPTRVRVRDFAGSDTRRMSAGTSDQARHSDADEISLAPSTPSLVSGGLHSAASSLSMFTPQFHAAGSFSEMEIMQSPGTPESLRDLQSLNETIEAGSQTKLSNPIISLELISPLRRSSLTKHKHMPSPLQQQNHVSDEGVAEVKDVSQGNTDIGAGTSTAHEGQASQISGNQHHESKANETNNETRVSTGNTQASADDAITPGEITPRAETSEDKHGHDSSLMAEPELPPSVSHVKYSDIVKKGLPTSQQTDTPQHENATVEVTPARTIYSEVRTPSEGFAQTRQELDFDFSSPWSAASPYSETSQPAFYDNLDHAVESEPEDLRSRTNNKSVIPRSLATSLVRSPPLPSTKTRRRSFGSAGFLGIRIGEPRLIEVGLRRALMIPMIKGMRGSPMTATSLFSNAHHQHGVRGQSASGTELGFAIRPSTAHGKGAVLFEPDSNQTNVKRSASSGMLQDLLLVEAKDNDAKREQEDAENSHEGARRRSASPVFFMPAVTFASRLMGGSK